MEGTWFALINAALFAMQAVVNIVYAKRFVTVAHAHETLITPASYALSLWILVYALEAVLVVVDVFAPRYSMFADANQPAQLRLCFGATCIFNIIWVFLYVSGHVYAATVVVYALWLALLVLYVYVVNDRNARDTGPFDWMLYLCNEVPISMYFAWVTSVAFTHLAMSMQQSNHGYLGLTTYISYLCIVILVGLLTSRYAQDLVAGLVIVWFLIAVSIKHVHFLYSVQCMDIAVRACAGEGAAIIAAVLAIDLCQSFMEERYVAIIPRICIRLSYWKWACICMSSVDDGVKPSSNLRHGFGIGCHRGCLVRRHLCITALFLLFLESLHVFRLPCTRRLEFQFRSISFKTMVVTMVIRLPYAIC